MAQDDSGAESAEPPPEAPPHPCGSEVLDESEAKLQSETEDVKEKNELAVQVLNGSRGAELVVPFLNVAQLKYCAKIGLCGTKLYHLHRDICDLCMSKTAAVLEELIQTGKCVTDGNRAGRKVSVMEELGLARWD